MARHLTKLNSQNSFEDILGYQIVNSNVDLCVESILNEMLTGKRKKWLACINPHSYVVALSDCEFSSSLHDADWLIPDGQGIVLASQILGGDIKLRITGSDIFYALNSRANDMGEFSVYFLGSTSESLCKIRTKFESEYPALRFSGSYSPPFKQKYTDQELDEMIEAINHAKPDILWVGLTAPKQEKWIRQNIHRLDIKFAAAVGAVFDFYTGRIKRSNPLFQRLGLEWFPRLLQEPRRLWRRMFVSAPIFIWHVVHAKCEFPKKK